MKKILVPADFSPNSKRAIRFAVHWAARQNAELVFIHVLNVLIMTRWSESTAARYRAGELEACRTRFRKFIDGLYKSMNITPGLYSAVVIQGYDPAKAILEYCKKEKTFGCICISTNGAGGVRKLFGTNTSELISKSSIPVLAIPKNYRPKPVRSILYATDFRNYKDELDKVLPFAASFQANVDIVHFAWPGEITFDAQTIRKLTDDYQFGLNVHVEHSSATVSLTENLQKIIEKKKPSVVVMFTNQDRNLMQRIFASSKAQELSFALKAPLLVFTKTKTTAKTKKHELA